MPSINDIMHRIYQITKGKDVESVQSTFSTEMNIAIQNHPTLKDAPRKITMQDFLAYKNEQDAKDWLVNRLAPPPTAQQLWNAVAAWEPLGTGPSSGANTVFDLLNSDRFGPIPLGKLRGEIPLALLPQIGCLTVGPNAFTSPLDYADTVTEAISYPDGHPSEGYFHTTSKGADDPILHQFVELGWVMIRGDGKKWKKTGHVLVIDADENRNKHPWFVLAHEWEEENEVPDFDDVVLRPEKKIKRHDSGAPGILPGHRNRTPIARLIHCGPRDTSRPLVQQFGPIFSFDVKRGGKEWRVKHHSERGPDLVDVMHWYWDAKEGQQVCFNSAGEDFMRFNPITKEYRGPYKIPQGGVGNIEDDGPVTVASRLERESLLPSSAGQGSSTSGSSTAY